MIDIIDYLRSNSYPGRGILVGKNQVYYFIMGRSQNSRNRLFQRTEDGIRTVAYKPELLEDPSLIIYHPVRSIDGALVVTNGDQTDTIAEIGDFKKALSLREYEPDAPNFTPRISAILYENGSFDISILKRVNGSCLRSYFCYEDCPEGIGYFISTYQSDGNPLPSFLGEPMAVKWPAAESLWNALNSENKVSMYLNDHGKVTIFNKNLGD